MKQPDLPKNVRFVVEEARYSGHSQYGVFGYAAVASAAGLTTHGVRRAASEGQLDLGSIGSVADWLAPRRAEVGVALPVEPATRVASGRAQLARLHAALRLLGARSCELSFGHYMWLIAEDGWTYAGEVAGPLLAARPPALPPFSDDLQLADFLANAGRGLDDLAKDALRRVEEQVGPHDPVVKRLLVRRSRLAGTRG